MAGTSDGTDGEGWGRVPDGPTRPQPPSDEPDLWPQFERELRAYLEERERALKEREHAPVAG